MSRCVAFEGADLTGKTSLIDALQKRMPYSMWPLLSLSLSKEILHDKSGKSITEIETAYYKAVAGMTRTMSVLMDRCYVTNYVYGSVFGRDVDLDAIREVEAALRPVIVYVYTPLEVLQERLKRRGDDFVDRASLVKIFEGYLNWYYANPFGNAIVRVDSTVAANLDDLAGLTAERLAENR